MLSSAVRLRKQRRLSVAMEMLRAGALGFASGTTRDAFDACSWFSVAYADRHPIGMVRVTRASFSPLTHWLDVESPFPRGDDVVELTRGLVDEHWREHGIYRLLMLKVMTSLVPGEVRLATAAIEPDFVGRRFLADLGFRDFGEPLTFNDHPKIGTVAVPIAAVVDEEHHARWCAKLDDLSAFVDRSVASAATRKRRSATVRLERGPSTPGVTLVK